MRKEKALSFILASLISLSQIVPGLNVSQKAYASVDKLENEITSQSDPSSEDQDQKSLDIKTSLSVEPSLDYPLTNSWFTNTNWIFTIKNDSNRDIYLGEILSSDYDSQSFILSKNIYLRGFHILAQDFHSDNKLDNVDYDIECIDPSGTKVTKTDHKLAISTTITSCETIKFKLQLSEPVKIPAQKSLDTIVTTRFFKNDYNNPFDPNEWVRKDKLTDNDSKCLLNADQTLSVKANFYYDKEGKRPIIKEKLPKGSNFKDQASASFKLSAKVGDLSFGGDSNKPSEILIKKPTEDFKAVDKKVEARTDETLRFVGPVKISNANKAYQNALKNAKQKQYLINPSFLVEKEADDDSLGQKFYIRQKGTESLIELDQSSESIKGKDYYKLSLPANKLSDFMEEFDFVYDVTFTNTDRTHGLEKKVKLDFDNLGKVIDTKGDLTIDLKADYLNATKKVYQVDFDMDNHGEIKPQSVKKGQTVSEPEEPKADGYLFEGWYADKELTKEFDFTKPITENTTIYAKWAKLFDITYEFVSGSEGKNLPESINDLLKKIENKKYKVGETVKAPGMKFQPVKADGGTWTFEAWNEKEIVVSENSETNKFTGKWTFAKDNQPQPGKNDPDGKGNDTHNPKPGEGTGGNTGNKGGEHSDNPKDTESDKNKDKDKKDGGKDKPSSGDKDKKDSDKKDHDKKPSLKPADAPKEKVIRVNTDIYRPIPKGYKRVYFDPGKEACLKYNPSFDYGQVIAFDVKETMTFGDAKAQEKGLVIPTVIPKDKSLKFAGWSPKLQADGEFVEGVKYVALYEKIDKTETTNKDKKSKENPSKEDQVLVKSKEVKNDKEKKGQKLIADAEISQKENLKKADNLANKAKAVINKYPSPRTGVAGLGLVSGALVLASASLYLSKKSK